jgi:hypothetical protein
MNLSPDDIARFWSHVNKTKTCWTWEGPRATVGLPYGIFWLPRRTNIVTQKKAHRVSWVLERGTIPEGLFVLHDCDNPPCIRPSHLFIGTKLDNSRDCIKKGRRNDAFGEDAGRSKLTDDAVKEIRSGYTSGMRARILAKKYSVDVSSIYRAITGQNWRHVI